MTIRVGEPLPNGRLTECVEFDPNGCPVNPKDIALPAALSGKRIVIFGVPGAFTPTCSAKHVPSYVANFDELRKKGIDEIWCIAVNDAFVMAAWMRDQNANGKVRMLSDGSGHYTKALGLDLDLTARNMGVRSTRYSMLVENGVLRRLNVEQPGKYEVSSGEAMLGQL